MEAELAAMDAHTRRKVAEQAEMVADMSAEPAEARPALLRAPRTELRRETVPACVRARGGRRGDQCELVLAAPDAHGNRLA